MRELSDDQRCVYRRRLYRLQLLTMLNRHLVDYRESGDDSAAEHCLLMRRSLIEEVYPGKPYWPLR